jgi:hypothetical protein
VERTVVRGTVPGIYDTGRGINAQLSCDDSGCNVAARSTLTLVGSLIERNHDAGLVVSASDANVESTVVRDTEPRVADGRQGWGLSVGPSCTPATGCDPATRGTAHVTGSVFERNHEIGIAVMGSDATLTGVVVRDTWPRASDQQLGRGINIQLACSETSCDATARANVTIAGVLVDNNHDTGIFVGASDVVVEDAMVRATLPQASDGLFGRGVNAQSLFTVDDGCVPFTGSSATFRRSLIEDSYDVSLFVGGSDVALEGVVVRRTRARMFDGFNGDGVAVVGGASTASATITNTRIEESARAGLSNFGATVSLTMSSIACAAFALEGQAWEERDFVFDDHGENRCGCPAEGVCKTVTTGLAPPAPIEIEPP